MSSTEKNNQNSVIHYLYNNQTIDFISNGTLMVNATQMAKLFGKQVNEFMSNDRTKMFIEEALKNGNSRYLNIKNESDLIDSRQKSGTWMHRVLALKFAAWLDPAFELWVFTTIDTIILGHYKAMREATIEKLCAEKELHHRKQTLIANNPELAELFEIELRITAADRKRARALKASVSQLKLDLFPQPSNE